jgi:hypothetical protein
MKKSKIVLLMVGLCLSIFSLQAMVFMPEGDPDKACILEEFTPEHHKIYCIGEGSYCSVVGECAWLVIQ